MSVSSMDEDVITERSRELRRRRWLLLGAAVFSVLLLAASILAVYRVYHSQQVVLGKLAEIEAQLRRGVRVSVQQWESPAFSSGGATCESHDKGEPSPCECWYSTASSNQGKCIQVHEIAKSNPDTVLIFAAGGHDQERLSAKLRAAVCCNRQLALARAELVSTVFGACLEQTRKDAPRGIEYPTPEFVPSTRGAHNFKSKDPQDRTVTITLVRMEASK